MDRVQATNGAGRNVWINRVIVSGAGGSVMVMLVAYELFKKFQLPQKSWSSLQAKLKKLHGCGQASVEQLRLLRRVGVVSPAASSVTLITVAAAESMFEKAPELQAALSIICCMPKEIPTSR